MEIQTSETTPAPAGCLLRLVWMLVGNGVLYLSLVTVVATGAPLPSYLDVVAALAVGLMIAARRLDITRFGGRTVSGELATLRDWRRHTLLLITSAAIAWLLAHYLAGNLPP